MGGASMAGLLQLMQQQGQGMMGGVMGQQQPSSGSQPQTRGRRYQHQLERLEAMGFIDREANLQGELKRAAGISITLVFFLYLQPWRQLVVISMVPLTDWWIFSETTPTSNKESVCDLNWCLRVCNLYYCHSSLATCVHVLGTERT